MGRKILIITLIIFTILSLRNIIFNKTSLPSPNINVKIGPNNYNLEVAKTDSDRQLGLSNRQSLCEFCGMIFVFEKEGIYPFWMKNTLIPLDMIWLSKDGKIVDTYTAQPQPGAKLWELKTYPNRTPAKYVIELNSGSFQKNNLRLGDTISLPTI